jgi:tripartite-type tricarboxylate transporter receptor subunit TctC
MRFEDPRLAVSLLTASLLFAASQVAAQEFPSRPIRLVVPTTAGSVADAIARIVGAEMSIALGQPVVVEDKPGAGGIIGFEFVKNAPADGYTLLAANPSTLATYPLLVKDLRFDPLRDLPPIISTVEGRNVFGTAANAPWKTFKELAAYAKANPNKLNYGTASPLQELTTAAVLLPFGINAVHIPYNATAPYYNALMAGDVHIGLTSVNAAVGFGQKFRVLAVTGTRRAAEFPDVPTFSELGLPYTFGTTSSLNARAETPEPVLQRLHAAAQRALSNPEARRQFEKQNVEVVGGSREEAAKQLADFHKMFSELARKLGIQPK